MSIPTKTKRLYTRDLIDLFEVSRMTICRWIKSGRLPQPTGTVGDAFFWDARTIEDFLVDGDGLELVDTSRRTMLDNPSGDPEIQARIDEANELASAAEAMLVRSKMFDQKLRLDLLLKKRELSILENEERHEDGESWKG